ncbi:MAG: L-aspartate oxidase [Ruminococcaceae bacterium]|nr:L-aspartate oxidase [Oscillospiraceae bacterium]
MRRYLFGESLENLEVLHYDVLICGSGIAGLYSGLNIDESKKCLIITKSNIEHSNSYLAQGGIAAVIAPDDKFESHVQDTLRAGAGLCNEEAVKVLVSEGPENIKKLVEMDVPFDVNPEGDLLITLEGGHTHRRIVHCGGDSTGRETTRRLGQIALTKENIDVLFDTYLVDIITDNGKAVGAVIYDKKPKIVIAPNIILCTGGCGALYELTTNPKGAVGEGIAAAFRAGAAIVNMEMVQFHPTTLVGNTEKSENLFLISEAVRGEGGKLKNSKGERFMTNQHELGELAPRDIVTRGILKELAKSGESNVYLDVSSMTEEFFSHRFPTIFKVCREVGINVPYENIPVRPAQHYLMGGIKTNIDGMTSIEGLYACGEVAWTGIHGGNRLASNSMLECLVFGRRAALDINKANRKTDKYVLPVTSDHNTESLTDKKIEEYEALIRRTMTEKVSAVRTVSGLTEAKELIDDIFDEIKTKHFSTPKQYELYSLVEVAQLIITHALGRKESIGAHYIVPEENI